MDNDLIPVNDVKQPALDAVIQNPQYKLSVKTLSILLLRGASQAEISRLFSVSQAAVSQYIKRHYNELSILVDRSGDLLSQEFKHLSLRLVHSVKSADIKKAGLRDRIVSAGIALDKSQVLQGLPSDISAVITVTPEELISLRRNSAKDAERDAFGADKP